MPLLNWINRNQAEQTANNVPYQLLNLENTYGDEYSAKDNLIIQGDNLQALKALIPLYAGKVKCVFIDPPYNTKSAFEHYDDRLEHSQWLSVMYPRLQLLKELLSEDGSIWITLDDNEAHYMKVMCDEIFGRANFVANVVWQKRTSPDNRLRLGSAHDHIIVYGKDPKIHQGFNQLEVSASRKKNFKNPDNDPRGAWASTDFTGMTGHATLSQFYTITTPTGKQHKPPEGRCWAISEESFLKLVDDNRVWFGTKGNSRPRLKRYLSELSGQNSWTWWTNSEVGHNQESKKEVNALFGSTNSFDTPKPERLIQRILHLATEKNDLILDSFLGSGTTSAVAHKMGRRYIGIEMGEHAKTHVIPRLQKVIEGEQGGISTTKEYYDLAESTLTELDLDIDKIKAFHSVLQKIGKETDLIDKETLKALKQATKTQKIKSESVWQGGGGFSFYTLGATIFDEYDSLNADVKFNDLASYVWWLETKTSLTTKPEFDNPYIGTHEGVAYYLLYNGILGDRRPNGGNVLTTPILNHLEDCHAHIGKRVIIGEASRLGEPRLKALNIEFKQIPYTLRGN